MVMVVPVLLPVAVPMFLTKAMAAVASECSRATNPSASAVVTSASLPLPFIASSVLADERIVATAARGEGGLMAALPPFFGCGGARITLARRSCQGTQRIREPPPGLLLCHLRCVAKIRRRQPHQEEPCREKLRGARLASTTREVLASFTVLNLGMFYNGPRIKGQDRALAPRRCWSASGSFTQGGVVGIEIGPVVQPIRARDHAREAGHARRRRPASCVRPRAPRATRRPRSQGRPGALGRDSAGEGDSVPPAPNLTGRGATPRSAGR